MAWISRANLPKTKNTASARHCSRKGSGNSSSTDPVAVQDTATYLGCWGYACAMDAPQVAFTPNGDIANTTAKHQSLPNRIDKSEPRDQMPPHEPRFDSIVPDSPGSLKRKLSFIEIHPAKPRSPNALAHCFSPPNSRQPLSINDYGPAYPIQSLEVPGIRHSMTGMLKEPLEAYNAPCCFDYCA